MPISEVFKDYIAKKYFFNALIIKNNEHNINIKIDIPKYDKKKQDRTEIVLYTICMRYLYDYFKNYQELNLNEFMADLEKDNSKTSKGFLVKFLDIPVNWEDTDSIRNFMSKFLGLPNSEKTANPNSDSRERWLIELIEKLNLKLDNFSVEIEDKIKND